MGRKRKSDCTPEEWAEITKKRKEYYEKNKKKIQKYQKEYHKKNRDHINEVARKYYSNNKDKYRMYNSKEPHKEAKKKWRQRSEVKEKIKKYNKEYRKINKERLNKEKKAEANITKNLFSKYAYKLSIDEECVEDENGYLTVVDFHTKERFYPTRAQIRNRIGSLNGRFRGENHLYKNQSSKDSCPIFGKKKYLKGMEPRKRGKQIKQVDEYWRSIIISRANGHCERCGKESDKLIAHHTAPRATCAFDGDIDNGMALCPECHKEVHSTDGCRFHELAAEKRETA